jgi:hypothetical protein
MVVNLSVAGHAQNSFCIVRNTWWQLIQVLWGMRSRVLVVRNMWQSIQGHAQESFKCIRSHAATNSCVPGHLQKSFMSSNTLQLRNIVGSA